MTGAGSIGHVANDEVDAEPAGRLRTTAETLGGFIRRIPFSFGSRSCSWSPRPSPAPYSGDTGRVIRGFAAFCDANSWVPVVYSVHPHVLPVFGELGWQHLSVGEETLVRHGRRYGRHSIAASRRA